VKRVVLRGRVVELGELGDDYGRHGVRVETKAGKDERRQVITLYMQPDQVKEVACRFGRDVEIVIGAPEDQP